MMPNTICKYAVLLALALFCVACGLQQPEGMTSEVTTPVVTPIRVKLPAIEPSAEISCWGFAQDGKGFKEWSYTPALQGTWEELPACESGAVSITRLNALVETSGDWVWSGVLSKLRPGAKLGTINCDDTGAKPLYAYTPYNDCMGLSVSYSGIRVSIDPLVVVPNHP